jgi:rhamnose transport system substrate-binding protein
MDFNRRQITKGLAAGLATSTALTQLPRAAFAEKKLRVAMVVKVLGINYFDVGRDGGQEAAKELGDVELITQDRPRRPLSSKSLSSIR